MTDAQIFQVLGIIYLAVGIGIILNPSFYKNLLAVFSQNPPAVCLSGLAALVVGFLLVTFHNNWVANDWTVIITILGWVSLIKGCVLLLFPRIAIKLCGFFDKQMTTFFSAWAVVIVIAGALLSWLGFFCEL